MAKTIQAKNHRQTIKHSEPSRAGEVMSGGDTIIQVLAEMGVDVIFGYTGGSILPTYDALHRYNEKYKRADGSPGIRLIVPTNEQSAVFAASGYARSTGKPGVSIVTSGPGATNTVTPIRDCMADSIPVVLITGQVPRPLIGTDAFQEAPVLNIFSNCCKHVFLVEKPENLESTLRSAFHIATSGRPGPVVVDVPKDIQVWHGPYKGDGALLPNHGYFKRIEQALKARISKDQAMDFYNKLGECDRPLLYVGGGVISADASEAVRQFSEMFKIPAVTTLMGIGATDTRSDLSLGMLGMHGSAYANYAVEDCDAIISVGSRFDDRVVGNVKLFAPGAKFFAHIDIDSAELGKVCQSDWAFAGDARQAMKDLAHYGKAFKKVYGNWSAVCAKMKKDYAMNYDRKTEVVQPEFVLETLDGLLREKKNTIVCKGVGQHQMFAALWINRNQPRSFLTSASMGTMGFGLPAAIGACVGRPDAIVIDVDGDGSIRMNMGELETPCVYDLPVKILLLNNRADGMVRQWQKTFFGKRFSGSCKMRHRKDFVAAAEANAYEFSKRVEKKKDLAKIMKAWLDFDGPAFLEVIVDRDACVYPFVAPGMGYADMMTGNFINSRKPVEKEEVILDYENMPDLLP